MSENRVTKQTNDGKLVQALGKFYKSGTSLSLMGVDYRIPTLQKLFSEHIAVTNEAEQAHVDLNAAVAAQAESEAAIRPIRRALSNVVKAKFGESSATIVEFGFKPKKVTEDGGRESRRRGEGDRDEGGRREEGEEEGRCGGGVGGSQCGHHHRAADGDDGVQAVTSAAPVAQVAQPVTTTLASAAATKGGTGS